ncbi:VOC family protein [Streptomyces filamentosus]|uniref:VOC family protein n=1 Tax=Streptomyces filamentosus TaxID=67294 RepID=UPI00123BDDC0|nr:VOC family protein [Streptomyces filamentosus]KAA6220143.1 Pterin-4-alpha-carbinolamine dehydratase [Streptomyces filamentosus]
MIETGQTENIRPLRFHETSGLEDWRVVGEGACAFFRTETFAAGAAFVGALADVPADGSGDGADDGASDGPDVDLRPGGVLVRLVSVTEDYYGLTTRHLELARRISELARAHGLAADPSGVRTVQVTLDALELPAVLPFWRALLGYENRAGSDEDLIDPLRRGAPFYFQRMDEPRGGRNRVHVDVWVPYDEAGARIAAALAAGGRIVNDADAPSNWVLADPEGNEACVGVAGPPGA